MTDFLTYIYLLTFTVVIYFASLWLYRKTRLVLLNPLLVSGAAIILMLYATAIEYEKYKQATWIIEFLLGPMVVALAIPLYRQMKYLKENLASILTSVTVGAFVGIVSVVLIMRLANVPYEVEASVVPKSVTIPIAIQVSKTLGGIPGLTGVIVGITGLIGGVFGPFLLRALGVTDRIAIGLAIGSSAHGLGTSRAMELGALEGAISGLAMGLMGLITAVMAPLTYIAISWLSAFL